MSAERVLAYIKLFLDVVSKTTKASILTNLKGKEFGDVWSGLQKYLSHPQLIKLVNDRNKVKDPFIVHELIDIKLTKEIKEYLSEYFECPAEIEIQEEEPKEEFELLLDLEDPPKDSTPDKAIEIEEAGDIELSLHDDDEFVSPINDDPLIGELTGLAESSKPKEDPMPTLKKTRTSSSSSSSSSKSKDIVPKTYDEVLPGETIDGNLPSFEALGYKPEWIIILRDIKQALNELLTMKINFFAAGVDVTASKYKNLKFPDESETSGSMINVIYQTDIHIMQFKSNSIHVIYVYKFKDTTGKAETMRENYVESSVIKYGTKLLEKTESTAHPVELKLMKAIDAYSKISKEIKDHLNSLTVIEKGMTSTGNPKNIFTFKCKPNMINSDVIYNLKEMFVKGQDMILSKTESLMLGNDYKFSYPYKTLPTYLKKGLAYPELFKIFDKIPSFSASCCKKICKNTYLNRFPLIYHPKIEGKLDAIWEECKGNLATLPETDVIKCWKEIFNSPQAKNIICKGYKASQGFESLILKLIVHPESIKLMAYPDKQIVDGKKSKDDCIIIGALYKISFIFGPYMLKLPEEIPWKKNEAMVARRNNLLGKLSKNVGVVDYNSGYWFYFLDHDLSLEVLGSSGTLLIHLTKSKSKKDE